jgi:preprotein translocase subunit YajC
MTVSILLQAGGASQLMSFLPMVLIIIVFYFFMIHPQMKKAKDQKKFIEELKKGDKVITSAGIHGRIVDMNETSFLIEVESGAKIRFDKSAISLDASKALNAVKA